MKLEGHKAVSMKVNLTELNSDHDLNDFKPKFHKIVAKLSVPSFESTKIPKFKPLNLSTLVAQKEHPIDVVREAIKSRENKRYKMKTTNQSVEKLTKASPRNSNINRDLESTLGRPYNMSNYSGM